MRIVIPGWGSLIWNPGNLAMTGEWQPDGPMLPVEFARVSTDGRLTLVIAPDVPAVVGADTVTSYIVPDHSIIDSNPV